MTPGRPTTLAAGRIAVRRASRETRAWLRWHWDHGQNLPPAATPSVVVTDEGAGEPPPSAEVRIARGDRDAMEWAGAGDEWWGGELGRSVRLVLGGAPFEVHACSPVRPEGGTHWLAVHLALTEAMRAGGYLPMHAAVIERAGVATAIVGPSGAGKSTAAMAAARRGWRVVAEDLAWVDPGAMTVHRWDRGIRLHDDSYRRLGAERGARAPHRDEGGKRRLPYAGLGDAGSCSSATLAHLVVLGPREDGATRREPLAPRDRVRALWEATGAPFTDRGRAMAAAGVQRLLEELSFELVRVGSDSAFPAGR
ncbi:MAG TPA: hypothetical protein VFI52_07975 [Gemmatimonadaceae bacterium]|nr:hypothetical protein [Gemmatimonadaceae bacterium]